MNEPLSKPINEFKEHAPVLRDAAIEALCINEHGTYIDATYGRGGHSRLLLKKLSSMGRLIVIDKDIEAINNAKELAAQDSRVQVCHGSFKEIAHFAALHNVVGSVAGILFDLGVSSPQLNDAERGFSFMQDGPLDMRMDQSRKGSAADFVNNTDIIELARVIREYGDERFAKRIAHAIAAAREQQPLQRTRQLVEVIERAIPFKDKNKHPATRTFQAIRIHINSELNDLSKALTNTLPLLINNGKLVVISFHSLEDKIVKNFIQKYVDGDFFPRGFPVTKNQLKPQLKKIGKAIKPNLDEINSNVRARSAVLRVAARIRESD